LRDENGYLHTALVPAVAGEIGDLDAERAALADEVATLRAELSELSTVVAELRTMLAAEQAKALDPPSLPPGKRVN
jgi:hypothetical protein